MKKQGTIPPHILIMLLFLLCIGVLSFLTPVLFPVDPAEMSLRDRLLPPSVFGLSDSGHLLGTDYMGRDVAVRLLYATRTSLTVSLVGLAVSLPIGTLLGVVSGLFGGLVDDIVVFLINIRLSIPTLIVGAVVATIFGADESKIILLIGLVFWTGFARQIRAQVIQLKTEKFYEASLAIGASRARIILEHILPNVASQIIVIATLDLSGIILFESSMSFLGIGVQPPGTSLGVMVSTGRDQLINNWWLAVIPIVVIVLIIFSASMMGDWVRDKLDPKTKNSGGIL